MERIEDEYVVNDNDLTDHGPEIVMRKNRNEWTVTERYQVEDARRTNQRPHKIAFEVCHDTESLANGILCPIDIEKMNILVQRF